MELQFEWDEEKDRINLVKHKVSFLTAAEIFANEIFERIDDGEDYGEICFIALGRVDGNVLPSCLHVAGRKYHPHHQRPEREQR